MEWKSTFTYYPLDKWHPWYAWFPVKVNVKEEDADYTNSIISRWVWFEYVDRRFLYEPGCDGGRYSEHKKLGTFTHSTNVESGV